ncbi:Holliday junction branch migration protein RuvA [Simiduia aestuariiviva]|uniref:Holliday junction branch migration complex subunit RuvA n=1 Tax=Simiduia aestuariiviva TaxID=1510459 RepID=A0A839UU30_9GAMM|nr:Holliday junction branch migration protein RuvA [Simiduia aestuariiviva]MBB3168865.1 Holliday junction DNA helicase RuvA [Simiduia aestuariiviva]
MIGRITGRIVEKQPPFVVVDTQGVGYEIQAPMTTFYKLPELGASCTLHTHLAISETAHQLFGFADKSDRELFRTLIKVSGVGPKMALGILSGMEAATIARCVAQDNVAALVKVPGVGKKTAERLVIELRDKLAGFGAESGALAALEQASGAPVVADARDDAEAALIALGYKPADATKAIGSAHKQSPDANSQELIRLALKAMIPV